MPTFRPSPGSTPSRPPTAPRDGSAGHFRSLGATSERRWNEYLYAVLFLSGETHITIPVAMGNFLATDNPPWNLLMAESVLYSIPPVILYYCFRRHLLSGLVSGAVSGV